MEPRHRAGGQREVVRDAEEVRRERRRRAPARHELGRGRVQEAGGAEAHEARRAARVARGEGARPRRQRDIVPRASVQIQIHTRGCILFGRAASETPLRFSWVNTPSLARSFLPGRARFPFRVSTTSAPRHWATRSTARWRRRGRSARRSWAGTRRRSSPPSPRRKAGSTHPGAVVVPTTTSPLGGGDGASVVSRRRSRPPRASRSSVAVGSPGPSPGPLPRPWSPSATPPTAARGGTRTAPRSRRRRARDAPRRPPSIGPRSSAPPCCRPPRRGISGRRARDIRAPRGAGRRPRVGRRARGRRIRPSRRRAERRARGVPPGRPPGSSRR